MKIEFKAWYDASYAEYLECVRKAGLDVRLIEAIYPSVELIAMKHFDGKAYSSGNNLKFLYYWLFERQPSFTVSGLTGEKNRVLLWPSQNKHYFLQKKIYDQLVKEGISVAFVSNRDSVEDEFVRDGVRYYKVTTGKSRNYQWRQLLDNRKLIRVANDFKPFINSNRTIHFKKIIADALISRNIYNKSVSIYKQIIRENKPEIILLGYSFSTVSLSIDKECRQEGIITAAVQMGRMMYYFFRYSALNVFYGYGKDVSDNIRKITRTVEPVEVGSVKVEVTENSSGKSEVHDLVKGLRSDFRSIGLVAFSGPGLTVSAQAHNANLEILKHAIVHKPETFFIVKFHGKDHLMYYESFKGLNNLMIIDHEHPVYQYDIMHLIRHCDFLISGASTTLIEAAYWLKPAISVDALGEMGHIDLLNEPFIYRCSQDQDLLNALNSIEEKDQVYVNKMNSMQAYSDYSFTKGDLKPSERIVQDMVKRLQER